MTTIDAKLRIAAEVTQAIAQLRAVKREILSTSEAAKDAARQPAAPGTDAAAPDTGAARQAQRERRQAARAERDEATAATRAQREAERETARVRRQAEQEQAEALRKRRAAERQADREKAREEQEAARRRRGDANLQTNALRQLPAQVTDIVTSLTSGQSPLTVAIQQGGQLRDSFGGFGAALRAVLNLVTPARLLIGGLAAALASVAGGAVAGALEVDRLNKALALTGNTAGVTVGQLGGIARSIAGDMKASIGDVRETLAELIEAGSETGGTLESSARAVTAYRKLTGASAAEAVKLFAGQRDSILDWATKANRAYNFLTAAQVEHIRQLQEQGRTSEAVRFANEELAKTLEQRSVQALGKLEIAWNNVKAAVSRVIDSFKAVGRPETVDDQIAAIEKRLEALRGGRDSPLRSGKRRGTFDAEIAQAQAELEALSKLRAADQVRAAERAVQQKAEQEQILLNSKQYTDAIAAVKLAGVQQELAATLKGLQARQSAIELAAQDALAAEERLTLDLAAAGNARLAEEVERVRKQIELRKQLELNFLEQERIQAQIAANREKAGIEAGRKGESPLDAEARKATAAQLGAELLGLQAQLQAVVTRSQQIVAENATQEAADWVKSWTDAAKRVQELVADNAATSAARVTDPQARARAVADAATAEARKRLQNDQDQIRVRITPTLPPVAAAAFRRELEALTTAGTTFIDETDRKARFASLRQSFDELAQAQQLREREIADAVEASTITTEEGEARKLAARGETIPQLERILLLLRELARTGDERNQVDGLSASVRELGKNVNAIGPAARQSAIGELSQGLLDIATRAKSAGEALRDMVSGFAKAMLQVLSQRLATKWVDDMIGAAQEASKAFGQSSDGSGGGAAGGGLWGALANWVVGLFHTGGVIGRSMGSGARAISPLAFAGAQVLHGGGLVGLASNERPIIAKVGEEMLTEDDPRHINNWRGGGGGVTVNASYSFQGGGGTEADQRSAAQDLDRRMRATVETWAAEQSRQGGLFSGGRRG